MLEYRKSKIRIPQAAGKVKAPEVGEDCRRAGTLSGNATERGAGTFALLSVGCRLLIGFYGFNQADRMCGDA